MPVDVHVLETGRLVTNRTFLRGTSWWSLLRRRVPYEFPVLSFVIEHEEGLIAVDAGLGFEVQVPRLQRRFVPQPVGGSRDIRAAMRRKGLDAADVRLAVLTHLDWDHLGGVAAFPRAEVLVHRHEMESARTRMGRSRYQPHRWPAGFDPALYDLDPEPYGPFPTSRRLTSAGDVRIVPLPGHSAGQVGVVVETGASTLLLAADHVLRQDWFLEDLAAGNELGLGIFGRQAAVETTRRIVRFARETPTVLIPSHDDQAAARLEAMEPLRLGAGRVASVA